MAEHAPPIIVGAPDAEKPPPARVAGTGPDDLIDALRSHVAAGDSVLVAPDDAAADLDDWIAIASVAVVEGATAIETHGEDRAREARRIFGMHHAIVTGGSELYP